jgi:hypothetical protein
MIMEDDTPKLEAESNIFRQEALEYYARGQDSLGKLVRISKAADKRFCILLVVALIALLGACILLSKVL